MLNLLKNKILWLTGGIVVILLGGMVWLKFSNRHSSFPGIIPQQEVPSSSVEEVTPIAVVAENLDTPWGMVFLPDNSILVTERPGRVRLMEINGNLRSEPVVVLNNVREIGEGGLLGIALHPNFSINNFVYLYYTYSENNGNTLNRVVRMTYQNGQLINEQVVVDRIPGASNHNGGRIKFGPDDFLYITTGDAQIPSQAQDINSLGGKILRVTDEGKPASGNPFNNLVYSYGHRNPQGLAWDNNGQLWETEHGPSGTWPNCCQDELNLIKSGENYGWPDSVGNTVQTETYAPILHSGRDIWAPAGTAIIDNSLFFAGLRGQSLYEAVIEQGQVKELKKHLEAEFGRLREVIVGPDNMLYITTSNRDGRGDPIPADDRIIKVDPQRF
jgi:glucose/arabinose dehydrogenase